MTATNEKRQYIADFYCFEKEGEHQCPALASLLEAHAGGHAPAHALEAGSQELFQVRSIKAYAGGNAFSAVFGRCKFGEKPEQASVDGGEEDVNLKPGYGLVEKNHFVFLKDLNLVIFQRNGNAGRYTHFQNYLNKPSYEGYTLLPVLTKDSYSRIENGGAIKKLEISVRSPALALDAETAYLKNYIDVFKGSQAGSMKVVLSGAKSGGLTHEAKHAFLSLARYGRAKVARAVMQEDNEVIDLIADRISHPMSVSVLANGRPDPKSMFEELAAAKDACASQLRQYFNP